MTLWLPGHPVVRREILRLDEGSQEWLLRPDASGAGISLRLHDDGLLLSLAGPERADVELELAVEAADLRLPLWGVVHGTDAEAALWDGFGRLAVPDLLARTPDAERISLAPGRYLLSASVDGSTTALIGVGLEASHALAMRSRRAAG